MPRTPARRYGQGSIFQVGTYADGKPRIAGDLYLGVDATGKPKRIQVYGRTRAEVVDKLNALIADRLDGDLVGSSRQTLREYLTDWLKTVVAAKTRPHTIRAYTTDVNTHILPALGHLKLQALTPQHIQRLCDELATRRRPKTVRNVHGTLRTALNHAVALRLLKRNPAEVAHPPRLPRHEVTPLDPDQARALLATVAGHRLEALYVVALSLGIRQGEALGLTWDDVRWHEHSLRVHQGLQRHDRKYSLQEVKSERSNRTIPLPEITLAALKAHKERQDAERAAAGDTWESWNLVFTTPTGRPLNRGTVTHQLYRLLAVAKIPRTAFHNLRHTAATLLLVQGVQPRVVMDILGHSQFSVTMNLYSHVLPVLANDAAARMNDVLSPPKKTAARPQKEA